MKARSLIWVGKATAPYNIHLSKDIETFSQFLTSGSMHPLFSKISRLTETITAIEVSWGQETWDDHFKFLSRDSVPTCRDECSCYHFAKSKWG